MTWEPPPQPQGTRRWVWPVVGLVTVIGLVVAVVLARPDTTGTLTVGPTAQPTAPGSRLPPVDPADFLLEPLDAPPGGNEAAGAGPVLPEAPGLRLVVAGENELHAIDLTTGDLRRTPLLAGTSLAFDPWTLFAVGDSLIMNATGDVVRLTGPQLRRVRIARNHRALPTYDDHAVWVVSNQEPAGPRGAVRVRLDGVVLDQIAYPAVAQPVAGVNASVLASTPSGIHALSRDEVQRLTGAGQLVAATDERLAWFDCAPDLTCQIVVGTFDDPDQARTALSPVELPSSYFGVSLGRFSPDGRMLAVPLLNDQVEQGLAHMGTVIIDTATGSELTRMRARTQDVLVTAVDWSPDSRLLFVALGSEVSVWNANTGAVRQLDVGLREIYGLAVTAQP